MGTNNKKNKIIWTPVIIFVVLAIIILAVAIGFKKLQDKYYLEAEENITLTGKVKDLKQKIFTLEENLDSAARNQEFTRNKLFVCLEDREAIQIERDKAYSLLNRLVKVYANSVNICAAEFGQRVKKICQDYKAL